MRAGVRIVPILRWHLMIGTLAPITRACPVSSPPTIRESSSSCSIPASASRCDCTTSAQHSMRPSSKRCMHQRKLDAAHDLFQGHVHDSLLNPGHKGLSVKSYIQAEHTIVAMADQGTSLRLLVQGVLLTGCVIVQSCEKGSNLASSMCPNQLNVNIENYLSAADLVEAGASTPKLLRCAQNHHV